jgi:amino acid transporter
MLLLIHAAATWFLTGVTWLVQVVHYPLFSRVGGVGYREYQRAHQSLITMVVGPAMLVEAFAAALLLIERRDAWTLAGVVLLLVVWGSTAFLQVPLHKTLGSGFDTELHGRLVQTNWLRTVCWSMRGLLALYLLHATA